MSDLIEALTILRKYGNPQYPTICEHDTLTIADINPQDVTPQDLAELNRLGYFVDKTEKCFRSHRYGIA